MITVWPIVLFIIGLLCLIFGGDWFVDGAVGLAKKFHVPEIIIGATIVSIGTTLPEVMVSATAAVGGSSAISYGNAIGSIICNTALIAAITMAIKPGAVDRKAMKYPVCFFFGSAIFYGAISYITGYFSRVTGIILLAGFVVYMIVTIRQGFKKPAAEGVSVEVPLTENTSKEEPEKEMKFMKCIVLLVIGAVLIAIGARLLVDNGTIIARWLKVPESVIGLTFVALGTSLPELVTAITSLVKGHSSLSVGNIIGANLFNLVLVSGISITIAPFGIPVEKTIAGMNASLIIDIPLMILVMLIMCLPALLKGKLFRAQGIILILLYAGFVAFQFFG